MTSRTHLPASSPARPAARLRYATTLSLGAAVAACGLLLAACGSSAAPRQAAAGSATSTTGTASAAKVSLAVTFTGSATTAPAHYTLRCEPASGTVTDAAASCARLLKDTSLFGPLPAHVMCPMILASAGRVRVTGTYLGRKVHETFVDGGCDLSRWSTLKKVFN